jgi:glycosyltransferase involved in cell wall biosynthesis
MSAEPHVLLIAAATSTSGGGERHVADLLRLLPARGFRVSLACPSGGDLPALAKELGLEVRDVPSEVGRIGAAARALRTALAEFEPDVAHAHGSRAAAIARVADPHARSRNIYTLHGIHIDKAGSPVRRAAFLALERVLRRRTARFITVCESDLRKGERLGVLDPALASVVYNGIPPADEAPVRGSFRSELGLGGGVPLVLSIGRFHQQKDQHALLAAWALVRDRFPDAVLALIGSGRLEGALREQALSLRLERSLRLLPPRADLAAAYADADVFALTSLWEGLPYVVLEAMAHGLPVVSTGVDGVPEAVEDGVSGILVPPSAPLAVAAAVAALLEDPGRRTAMGKAGRSMVAARFGLDAMADATENVYRTLLERR